MRTIVKERIFQRDGKKCNYCGSTERLEIDHIIPLSKGGEHSEHNFQVLCKTCNLKKGNKIHNNVSYENLNAEDEFWEEEIKKEANRKMIEEKYFSKG